jgi:proteasome activator subunit 4
MWNIDPRLAEQVLQQVFDYVTTTIRPNSTSLVHSLISAIGVALPVQTMDKFFHVCKNRILLELENGASSTRTNTSTVAIPSDAALHWYL